MGKRTNTAVWIESQSRWQIKVQKDGERRTFYSRKKGRVGQREANAKADAWLDDGIVEQSFTVGKLWEMYLADLSATASTSATKKLQSHGSVWIIPTIGRVRISALTEAHLQKVIDRAFAAGLAKKSLINLRSSLVGFLRWCRRRKASALMLEGLMIPQSAPVGEKRVLQPESLRVLFESDRTAYRGKEVEDEFVHAYRFAVLTGLRPGELIGLRWADVSGDVVSLSRSVNAYNETTRGKNENAIRRFVLSPMAAAEINAQRDLTGDIESVFGIVSLSSLSKRWRVYCEHNGIPYVSLYELRHTFVSVVKGLSLGELRPLIGHSASMDTLGWYAHQMDGEAEIVAKKVGYIFEEILSIK